MATQRNTHTHTKSKYFCNNLLFKHYYAWGAQTICVLLSINRLKSYKLENEFEM